MLLNKLDLLPHVRFGQFVALSGTRIAVVAPYENAAGTPDDPKDAEDVYIPNGEGVVYLFDAAHPERSPVRIVAPNGDPGDGQRIAGRFHHHAIVRARIPQRAIGA